LELLGPTCLFFFDDGPTSSLRLTARSWNATDQCHERYVKAHEVPA